MTRWDKIIIVVLFIISFVPYLVLMPHINKAYDIVQARVLVDGEAYIEIPLTGQIESKEYTIKTEYGENILVVEDEKIAVKEATCPDKVCKQVGFIEETYESIVCLPNKVYVEIDGYEEETEEIDIRTN